jgi:hypothetical protein
MTRQTLSLREVQSLIATKPLVIVRLEHSEANKSLIIKALKMLRDQPHGQQIFETLREFLSERAVQYNLTRQQNGARLFLLREIEKLSNGESREQGLLGSIGKLFSGLTRTTA